MTAPWEPTEPDLEAMAVVHVAYEFHVLAAQAAAFATRDQPEGTAAKLCSTTQPNWHCSRRSVIHVRLLDDFFRHALPRSDDSIVAQHYAPSWKPRALLDSAVRDRINAQVAHLTARRQRPTYDLLGLVNRCLETFQEFVATIAADATVAHRAGWFAHAEDAVDHADLILGDVSATSTGTVTATSPMLYGS